jgi:polyhydroxyalkanoate synthase subunit PhaE
MTNSTATASNLWVESQQKFWDAWLQMTQTTLQANPSAPNLTSSWTNAMEQWWKAAGTAFPTETSNQDFMGNLLEQGQCFVKMSEEMFRFWNGQTEATQWQDFWQQRIADFNTLFSQPTSPEAVKAMSGLLPCFELPFTTWNRMISSSSLFPGDWLQAFIPGGIPKTTMELHDTVGKFLATPAIGYHRESQEQLQRAAQLALNYQRTLQEYAAFHGKLTITVWERLAKSVMARAQEGKSINSLRELYDLWVDSAEEAHMEFAMTSEFADIYGRMVNALMALKHHSQNMVDEMATAMNLPTRKGMESLQYRQQELSRTVKILHREAEDVSVLRKEVAALRTELRALHNVSGNSASSSTELNGMTAPPPALAKPATRRTNRTATKPTSET